jgi:hypothetical protein
MFYLAQTSSGSKDVRDLLKIGKLARTPEDVGWLVNLVRKYGIKNEVQSVKHSKKNIVRPEKSIYGKYHKHISSEKSSK